MFHTFDWNLHFLCKELKLKLQNTINFQRMNVKHISKDLVQYQLHDMTKMNPSVVIVTGVMSPHGHAKHDLDTI